MPTGQERAVLAACDELSGHGYGFVLGSDIARKTGMSTGAVKDRLLGLDRDGLVELAPLENGDLKAAVTPKGREELAKYSRWAERPISEPPKERPITVVPKGLRSYDERDANFFPELVPGPCRSDGLPETIHFWKVRIEEKDPERTFKVGVIFGPSGCGKSSFVKAGLLPKLPASVIVVYVEATEGETVARLLSRLRQQVPGIAADLGLKDSLATFKASATSTKVLLVIDQFEQWLHARRSDENTELAEALRQCDGQWVQAILMVRDDFSMALFRFLDAIGIGFDKNHNFAVVDLFGIPHATKVLTAFGQAFGVLPEDQGSISEDQREFLDQAVAGLAPDGRVVSVRLALFAEMVKDDPWIPRTLDSVGGTEGIGVTFLERSFGSPKDNPAHWRHAQAARGVLKALLPQAGMSIKGSMKSYDAILAASGYADNPSYFEELLDVLDGELRLITPTDSDGLAGDDRQDSSQPNRRWYQLTHDFLVPSIIEWLTRMDKLTPGGRARLLLDDKYALWCSQPVKRVVLNYNEIFFVSVFCKRCSWTEGQREMMSQARRTIGFQTTSFLTIYLATMFYSFSYVFSTQTPFLKLLWRLSLISMQVFFLYYPLLYFWLVGTKTIPGSPEAWLWDRLLDRLRSLFRRRR